MTEQPDVALTRDLRFVLPLLLAGAVACAQVSIAELPWLASTAFFLGDVAGVLVLVLPLVCAWCLVRRRLANPPLYARASLVSIGLVELGLAFMVLLCILLRPLLFVLPR